MLFLQIERIHFVSSVRSGLPFCRAVSLSNGKCKPYFCHSRLIYGQLGEKSTIISESTVFSKIKGLMVSLGQPFSRLDETLLAASQSTDRHSPGEGPFHCWNARKKELASSYCSLPDTPLQVDISTPVLAPVAFKIDIEAAQRADALQASAAPGIVGGGIYDAVLAHCAMKAKVESIYTWNARHYTLCGPNVVGLLRTP